MLPIRYEHSSNFSFHCASPNELSSYFIVVACAASFQLNWIICGCFLYLKVKQNESLTNFAVFCGVIIAFEYGEQCEQNPEFIIPWKSEKILPWVDYRVRWWVRILYTHHRQHPIIADMIALNLIKNRKKQETIWNWFCYNTNISIFSDSTHEHESYLLGAVEFRLYFVFFFLDCNKINRICLLRCEQEMSAARRTKLRLRKIDEDIWLFRHPTGRVFGASTVFRDRTAGCAHRALQYRWGNRRNRNWDAVSWLFTMSISHLSHIILVLYVLCTETADRSNSLYEFGE